MNEPRIKVTRIGKKWHARLIENDYVLDEMACQNKLDIGWICREMLTWYSKLGGVSDFAEAARERHLHDKKPCGKIWYKTNLGKG